LTAKEKTMTTATSIDEHRIVVGIDGSASSITALDWAVRYAELIGATVETLTTWEWPNTYGVALVVPEGYDPETDARKVLEDSIKAARESHPGVVIRPIVVRSHPAPALIAASHGADLVVVGSRGHGEFTGMLLGSVSEHCVSNPHCPVVVVRQD
jgi:nucleotide-binding universal stress UspA family protein